MKTPTPPPATNSHNDWLTNCTFQSRQDAVARSAAPGILSQKVEKPMAAAMPEMPILERNIFPLIDDTPVVATLAKQKNDSREVKAELRTFRELSSTIFCPEKDRDSLPEYVVFSLIALLAVAWPIIAMLRTMASHWH